MGLLKVLLASLSFSSFYLFSASFESFPPFLSALRSHNTMAEVNWAVDLPSEVWDLVAAHRGVVGACQLMQVCKDAHAGGKEYLLTLPGLVVCGGFASGVGAASDVLRLDLATMRWEPMPALVTARQAHACCVVRGDLVVLGGYTAASLTSSMEMLSSEEEGGAFVDLPAFVDLHLWISRRCHAAGSTL
jgi:hypothetical protein